MLLSLFEVIKVNKEFAFLNTKIAFFTFSGIYLSK
jgi:hypothetical protein